MGPQPDSQQRITIGEYLELRHRLVNLGITPQHLRRVVDEIRAHASPPPRANRELH